MNPDVMDHRFVSSQGLAKSIIAECARQGIAVDRWGDSSAKTWLLMAVTVCYQQSPVLLFLLPCPSGRLTVCQKNRVKRLRNLGQIATWVKDVVAAQLLIHGIKEGLWTSNDMRG